VRLRLLRREVVKGENTKKGAEESRRRPSAARPPAFSQRARARPSPPLSFLPSCSRNGACARPHSQGTDASPRGAGGGKKEEERARKSGASEGDSAQILR